jgi:hypothetical protein
MAEQPEPEEGFKITDRRRREEDPPRGGQTAPPTEVPAPPRTSPPTEVPAPPRTSPESPGLVDLFMMLASEAVVALGDAPDPATGQRARALPHAAQMIDLLLLLRAKTEGNRTLEESQILEELVYDLQLRYVSATKSAE